MTSDLTYHRFLKAHGLGNDFVIFDGRAESISLTRDQIRLAADRRYGVGCDQLVILEADETEDCFMHLFNTDGTHAGACGNATRCVADLMMRGSGKDTATIRTYDRVLHAARAGTEISVNMGKAERSWQAIPLASEQNTDALDLTFGPLSTPSAVSMGNPHVIFFVDDAEAIDVPSLGPELEHHPMFPERANISVASLMGPDHIRLRVWERGAGITLACGTAACAATVAAHARGLVSKSAKITLNGGTLTIDLQDNDTVVMTGPVAFSFEGQIAL